MHTHALARNIRDATGQKRNDDNNTTKKIIITVKKTMHPICLRGPGYHPGNEGPKLAPWDGFIALTYAQTIVFAVGRHGVTYHGRHVCGWTLKTPQLTNIARNGSHNGDPFGTNVPLGCDIGQGCPQSTNANSRAGTTDARHEGRDNGRPHWGTNSHNDDQRTKDEKTSHEERKRENEPPTTDATN